MSARRAKVVFASAVNDDGDALVDDGSSPSFTSDAPDMQLEEQVEDIVTDGNVTQTTLLRTGFHILKSLVGTGIFLIPTIHNGVGFVVGPILLVATSAVVIDCMMLLVRTKQHINRPSVQTFSEVTLFCLGPTLRFALEASLLVIQFGICLLYIQFGSTVLVSIYDFWGSYEVYVASAIVILTPLSLLSHNLHLLAIASFIASVAVIYCVFATLVVSVSQLSSNGVADIEAWSSDPIRWILFVGSTMTITGGIGTVLSIENACARKDKYQRMLFVCCAGVLVMYVIYGLVGYCGYGAAIHTSTINILSKNWMTTTIQVALVTNLFFSLAIQYVPAIQVIDRTMGVAKRDVAMSKKSIAARFIVNCSLGLVALLIGGDTVTLVLGFIGSIASSFVGVVLPPCQELVVSSVVASGYPLTGRACIKQLLSCRGSFSWKRFKLQCYIVFGIFVMVTGTASSLVDAVRKFS